jgi:DNA-binding NarL/FixJ family response regulator
MFNVLLVDDSKNFRSNLAAILRDTHPLLGVEEAEDANEALRVISRRDIGLILMDIKLPGDNGIVLTGRIKASAAHISIVILTGYDIPQYRQAAFRSGADCFLYKGAASCMNDVLARVEGAVQVRR